MKRPDLSNHNIVCNGPKVTRFPEISPATGAKLTLAGELDQKWLVLSVSVETGRYPNHHGRLVLSEFAVFPLSNNGLVDQCLAVEHLDVRAECFSRELVRLKRRARLQTATR